MRNEDLIEVNLYKILEIPFNSTSETITAAFKVWENFVKIVQEKIFIK